MNEVWLWRRVAHGEKSLLSSIDCLCHYLILNSETFERISRPEVLFHNRWRMRTRWEPELDKRKY